MDSSDTADLTPLSSFAKLLPYVLALPRMTNLRLFALPGDPLPQAIMRLTGLTRDEVLRFIELPPAELEQVLLCELPPFYYFMLVGRLAYDSPLGEAVQAEMAELTEALNLQAEMLERLLPVLVQGLPDSNEGARITAALHELFAREKYSLSSRWPTTVPNTVDDDESIWMTMRPRARELNLFALALNLTITARFGVPHPLGEALPAVVGLGSDKQLQKLARRFMSAPPDEPLPINGADMVRLYLSLQVLALLVLADLQPILMARLDPAANANAPWHDPEQQQRMVEWTSIHIEALSSIFDENFAEEPAYQAAQAEARRLAALL